MLTLQHVHRVRHACSTYVVMHAPATVTAVAVNMNANKMFGAFLDVP